MNKQFIYPVAVFILIKFIYIFFMFIKRRSAVAKKEIRGRYFKAYAGQEIPENLLVVGNHFNNLFQVPILFMITVLFSIQFNVLDQTTLILEWVFVGSRVIHTLIHLGYNHPVHRALVYGFGWFVLIIMWIRILMA